MALQSESGVHESSPAAGVGSVEQEASMEDGAFKPRTGVTTDGAASQPAAEVVEEEASGPVAVQPTADGEEATMGHATPLAPAASTQNEKESAVEKARNTDVDRRKPPSLNSSADIESKEAPQNDEEIQSTSLFQEEATKEAEETTASAALEAAESVSEGSKPIATESSIQDHAEINGNNDVAAGAKPAVATAQDTNEEEQEVGGNTNSGGLQEDSAPKVANTDTSQANAGGDEAGRDVDESANATGNEILAKKTSDASEASATEVFSPRRALSPPPMPPNSRNSSPMRGASSRENEPSHPGIQRGWSEDFSGEGEDRLASEDDDRLIEPGKAVALFGFDPETNLELAFCEEQHMEVLEVYDDGWCMARNEKGATGLVPTAYLRMSHEGWPEEADDVSRQEFAEDGALKRRPSAQGPHLPPRCQRLGSFRGSRRKSSLDDEDDAIEGEAELAAAEARGEEEAEKPKQMSGTGPHGPWEIVQVITPAMANKLVLNRGAMFAKFSYKRASVGVRYKEERLVWLSGDGKVQWQDPLAPKHPAPSAAKSKPKSIALKEVKTMSKTAPEHYCVDEGRCIYMVTPVRSLLLEAKDSEERDFWFDQLHEHWTTEQANERHRKRQERLAQKDIDIPERRRQWIQEILPNFDKMRNTKQCKTICWLGVPTNLRAEVWVKCIGNQLQITKDLYEIFRSHAIRGRRDLEAARQRAMESGRNLEDDTELLGSESSLKVLDKDLPRTFRQLGFFHKGGPLEQQLRDVLEAYIFYRPDVGYVQGMSYLAAMLLLTMDTFQAFVALCNLLHSHYFLSFFAMDMLQIRIRFAVFEYYFEKQLPDLFATFEELGVTTDTYLLNWLMTLFSKSLPVDVTTRLWDNYLLNGESFMIRSALGVLKWLSQTFVDLPFEELMVTLTHLHDQESIDEDELFDCIAAIKVTEEDFAATLSRKKEEMEASFSKELSVGSSFYW